MNIFRSRRSQMFFKIGALKKFAIFWIKKSLQNRYFPVNIAKLLRRAFLQNFFGGCFYIILKVITKLNKHLPSVKVNLNSSFGGGPWV